MVVKDTFLAICVIIMQISNLFEFYKLKKIIKQLREEGNK